MAMFPCFRALSSPVCVTSTQQCVRYPSRHRQLSLSTNCAFPLCSVNFQRFSAAGSVIRERYPFAGYHAFSTQIAAFGERARAGRRVNPIRIRTRGIAGSPDVEAQNLDILHHNASTSGEKTYIDPETGYTVFTALAHLKRGHCCGVPKADDGDGLGPRKWRCRHCPFDEDGTVGPAARYLKLVYTGVETDNKTMKELISEETSKNAESSAELSAGGGSPAEVMTAIDEKLSKRRLWLDPGGYFLIRINKQAQSLEVEHHECTVDPNTGLVVDTESGKAVAAKGKIARTGRTLYSGKTAKEVCVALFEGEHSPVTQFNHAAYVGRELARAEECLRSKDLYVQD
eukprot:CAMPEP_0198214752 /NCGR_PEP_ID=MMETSP1445-20131203/43818_1 /TAXON_ID=36898 /ORGANISM="Pyramimonas sp., Strain CCMP2087" /LENGTH=342 /DNA_ID=CAMNT_0043890071 /DNA_START=79 /DNA_END=1107 /DNA_ORIENTATION=-